MEQIVYKIKDIKTGRFFNRRYRVSSIKGGQVYTRKIWAERTLRKLNRRDESQWIIEEFIMKSKAKIAVLTLATENLNYSQISNDNSKRYCAKHGYDFLCYKNQIDKTRSVIQSKIYLVIANIQKYDWILMKDADSLFYNFDRKIEDYINENSYIIGSTHLNQATLNAGALLIKCNEYNKKHLEELYYSYFSKAQGFYVRGEQYAINRMIQEHKLIKIKSMPNYVFNAVPENEFNFESTPNDETLIVHWLGKIKGSDGDPNFSLDKLKQFEEYNNYINNIYI